MAKPVDENRLLRFWNDIKKSFCTREEAETIIRDLIDDVVSSETGSGGGITAPVNGFFTMAVDEDGNLWAYSADDGTTPPFEYDSVTGNLYVVLEVE